MSDEIETVAAALAPIRDTLQADGYDIQVDRLNAGTLSVSILAGPDACPDCLVPKPIMETHVLRMVTGAGLRGVRSVRVEYPDD